MKKTKRICVDFDCVPYNATEEYNKDGIRVAHVNRDIETLCNPKDLVIPLNRIRVIYDYPLRTPTTREFISDDKKGFTRIELVRKLCKEYRNIYDEEEAEVRNPGMMSSPMFNRAESHGPHGIWGHDLEDLVLMRIKQCKKASNGNEFLLEVDS